MRSLETIREAFAAGAQWVVLGTVALADTALVETALEQYAARIVVAIDARDGRVATEGWTRTSNVDACDLARQMEGIGVRRLLCTDIASDGMLSGPNVEGLRRIAQAVNIPVIASGGVSSLEDIRALLPLEPLGIIGVIVGRALYEGRLDLRQAIAVAPGSSAR
jgi:phosphoribosylformimino-5-aminoimidazole carboxamide ribotide isomerase